MRFRLELVFKKDIATENLGSPVRLSRLEFRIEHLQRQLPHERFVRISDDVADLRERSEFFGRTLRVASCDNDASCRISGRYAADHLSRVSISFFRDRAGVDDDDIGREWRIRASRRRIQQLLLDSSAFGL